MRRPAHCAALVLLALAAACEGATEAARVELPVVVEGAGVAPVETDLGYTVTLVETRAVVADLEFSVAGEAHGPSLAERLHRWLVPRATAHPGHYTTGEVTGELRGRFVVDWLGGDGAPLGTATLLAGAYESADFTLARGAAADGLPSDDALLATTAVLRGTAAKGGQTVTFTALIESPEGRQVVGAPFVADIGGGTAGTVGLRLETRDPLEEDTLFDGIDFLAVDEDGDGAVRLAPDSTGAEGDARDLLRRTFQTHDHFRLLIHAD